MTHYAVSYMAVTAQCLYYNYTMIENYTFLRNESQFLKFLYFREVVVSAKCLFGEKSARHTVRSTKCPFGKMSFGKVSFGKVSFGKVSFGKMSGYRIVVFNKRLFRREKDDPLCSNVIIVTNIKMYPLFHRIFLKRILSLRSPTGAAVIPTTT